MKVFHFIALMVGIVLLLATESENAITNIIGLLLVVYECYYFNLFNDGRNDKRTNVA